MSFVDQLVHRNTFLQDSDDSNFSEFQDAVSNHENWIDGVKVFVGRKMDEVNDEHEDEDNEKE